jgi:NADH-quinone oxidoreductase subunit A
MMAHMEMFSPYVPLLIMFGIAAIFAATFLGLSAWLGPRRPTASKLSVYECGLEHHAGSARERFSVKFYLVAILFILFDIEVVFLYPWAVNYRSLLAAGQGVYMLAAMGVFFILLTLGLVYEWRKGALDWSKVD